MVDGTVETWVDTGGRPLGLQFDHDGNLQDPSGATLREITSVEEHEAYLYIGSLSNDRIGRFVLKE